MCNTYSGYTNYATWAVGLWIDNDQGSSNFKDELVEQADTIRELADSLKDWITEDAPVPETGMFSDIFGWALEQIDWHDLAKVYWEDKETNDDE